MTKLREADVLRAVLDLLTAEGIWHERRNTGAMVGEHNGKKRFTRFGKPGVADVLAMLPCWIKLPAGQYRASFGNKIITDVDVHEGHFGKIWSFRQPVWIEVKAPGGKQSQAQKDFQSDVEANGMTYLLVSDVQTLIDWLRQRGEPMSKPVATREERRRE